VIHFSYSLLRIKGLYIFRALLAHPEVPDIISMQYTKCRLCSTSGGWASTLQPYHSQLTYACNIPNAVCGASPEDEQVMLEKCRGLGFSINWMKSASRWLHYTDILWCTVSHCTDILWCTVSKTLSLIYLCRHLQQLLYPFECRKIFRSQKFRINMTPFL
jgi:hypothetical protein